MASTQLGPESEEQAVKELEATQLKEPQDLAKQQVVEVEEFPGSDGESSCVSSEGHFPVGGAINSEEDAVGGGGGGGGGQ